MIEAIRKLDQVDPAWDARISDLLESTPSSDVMLPLIWAMDDGVQWLAETTPRGDPG